MKRKNVELEAVVKEARYWQKTRMELMHEFVQYDPVIYGHLSIKLRMQMLNITMKRTIKALRTHYEITQPKS